MIYDCFTFYNEMDLLEIRLELLYEKVDYFIIIEANKTHTGIDKPFNYLENIARYEKYQDKIKYYNISNMPEWNGGNAWTLENFQRNSIMLGLTDAADTDTIIISDIDEILNPTTLDNYDRSYMYRTEQEWCCFYANRSKGKWNGSVLGPLQILKQSCPQHWRNMRASWPNILVDAGWHYSWFGGVEAIIEKVQAFAETQDNTPYNKDPDRIKNCLLTDEDVWKQAEVRPYSTYPDIFLQDKFLKHIKIETI